MKKAEREKKKLELEAEFAGVFGEIERKRGDLKSLEDNITNMEAMRQRKDREFQRLQRNLTELLAEQKAELDALRQKGVEMAPSGDMEFTDWPALERFVDTFVRETLEAGREFA